MKKDPISLGDNVITQESINQSVSSSNSHSISHLVGEDVKNESTKVADFLGWKPD